MNRSPLPFTLSAALAVSLLFLPGCKTTNKEKDEKTSGTETDKDRAKRTGAEAAFYAECGKLGETGGTVNGRDGWLFSASELLQLSRISNTRAAVGSIADYAQQLRGQNIDLIVVPVPPKVLIYPDMVSKAAKVPMKSRRPARLDSLLKAAMDELSAKKIRVVDLTPVFIAHRDDKDGPVFPRNSNTWSPYGVQIATKEIAEAVRASRAGKNAGAVTGITAESVTLTFTGGLVIGATGKVKPETFRTTKIGRISGDKVRSLAFNTSGGSVLMMGDDNVLAWREANNPQGSNGAFCSLAEQLSAELQLIPDVLSTSNDGRNTPRLRILRERTNGHGMLESTRAVIWVIPALDLTAPNWQRVPLQLQYSEGAPDLKLR
jgi:alginate O-acetyltransferase complex protein AlgJ